MRELYDYYATVRIGDCTYQFADKISTDDFNARLLCENGRVRLIVTPDESREQNLFDTLAITAKTKITNNDRLFVNGYQSWTDSKEYETHERMTGIDHIPKALVRKYNFDKYGDYSFTSYSDREGDIHGFSYGYIREGSEFTLFGSLDEADGFTLIRILSKDGEVSFEKALPEIEPLPCRHFHCSDSYNIRIILYTITHKAAQRLTKKSQRFWVFKCRVQGHYTLHLNIFIFRRTN